MQIYFVPVEASSKLNGILRGSEIIFHYRDGVLSPFLHHVRIETDENATQNLKFDFCGDLVDGWSFTDLQDGDILFYTVESRNAYGNPYYAFHLDMHATEEMLLPFESEMKPLDLAAGMEEHPFVCLYTSEKEDVINKAKQIYTRACALYAAYPAYQHIMLNTEEGPKAYSLVNLAARQEPEVQDTLIAFFLAISAATTVSSIRSASNIAGKILEKCKFTDSFSLLTQEEQVEAFITFSRMAANKKQEYVPDSLIHEIESSPEYGRVKEDLARNGLGESETQQFNVLQQVGFFSKPKSQNIIYNLSDMGAGKTLMTVEAIFLMDLKQISQFMEIKSQLPDDLQLEGVRLPDKHIITPTLSVKSSWIDTFHLFYEVEESEDEEGFCYLLKMEYMGISAVSKVYVAPFTVKDGKIFSKGKLPEASRGAYLIIDEIHQLVIRNVAKTKFFPPNTRPCDLYKIFILSGTMSNLKTEQWYNYKRFMGLPISTSTVAEAERKADEKEEDYQRDIVQAAQNIKSQQHRYFDAPDLTKENCAPFERTKKQTVYEREFYARYGSQILDIRKPDAPTPIRDLLTNATRNTSFSLKTDPSIADTINFELFYQIVGNQAITAQSTQIAEELFGEQKKQHVSDIIKTVSPLSKDDIQILKTLHHIAEDHAKYKSVSIAKAINNAILNLNDGLQTKNIYEIVSGFAERNMKFFEYLSTLDINILEQLPESGLIQNPKLEETDKFKVLKDILEREKEETHLIVVNDFYALKALSEALGIEHLTKKQLKDELSYQETLDALFEKQSIVIVTQDMIKSSLDLVQANRLIQYQLNTEISDIIQTQNRINRIGQTRETRGYYIASDQLQENLIELFLESYRNIRVAHKGIVELFTDITSQINVVNDYLERAFKKLEDMDTEEPEEVAEESEPVSELEDPLAATDLATRNLLPEGAVIDAKGEVSRAILFPQNGVVLVLLPLRNGNAFPVGTLKDQQVQALNVTTPMQVVWNIVTDQLSM